MVANGSVNAAARRLRGWGKLSIAVVMLEAATLLVVSPRDSGLLLLLVVVPIVTVSVLQMWGVRPPANVRWIVTSAFRARWLKSAARRGRFGQPLDGVPIAESFEVDLPCERCGAPNVGQEAGETENGWVFRTCDTCGHTQWWRADTNPPRVRRRQRPAEPQAPRAFCPRCGYDLAGVPLRNEDRGSGRVVLVQQCSACGRAEVVVPGPGRIA